MLSRCVCVALCKCAHSCECAHALVQVCECVHSVSKWPVRRCASEAVHEAVVCQGQERGLCVREESLGLGAGSDTEGRGGVWGPSSCPLPFWFWSGAHMPSPGQALPGLASRAHHVAL